MISAGLENAPAPQSGVEHGVRVNDVDENRIGRPFQGDYSSQLCQRGLRRGVCRGSGSRRSNILGTDHDHTTATIGQPQHRVGLAQQFHCRVKIDSHHTVP